MVDDPERRSVQTPKLIAGVILGFATIGFMIVSYLLVGAFLRIAGW